MGRLFLIKKPCNFFDELTFSYFEKKMMATFDADFIFCCLCFVPVVHDSIFLNFNFSYEYVAFYKRRNPRKRFEYEMFAWCKSFIVT